MTATRLLKLFKIANKYFANEADATQFVSEIEAVVNNKFEDKSTLLATREFVKEEIASLRKENAETKAELIKWMFIFWIGQLGAMLAIILLFVRK